MAVQVYKVRFTFRDSQGRTAVLRAFAATTDGANLQDNMTDVRNKLQAVSNAHVVMFMDPPLPHVYGTNAEFPSAQDKASLVFENDSGAIHQYQIPAPKLAIFLADGVTVNPANTDVVNLVGAIISNFVSSDSRGLVNFVGGIRLRRALPRRTNIFVKNPQATTPEE